MPSRSNCSCLMQPVSDVIEELPDDMEAARSCGQTMASGSSPKEDSHPAPIGVGSRLPGVALFGLVGGAGQTSRRHAVDALLGVLCVLDCGEAMGYPPQDEGVVLGAWTARCGNIRDTFFCEEVNGALVVAACKLNLGKVGSDPPARATGVGSRLPGVKRVALVGGAGHAFLRHAVEALLGVLFALDCGEAARYPPQDAGRALLPCSALFGKVSANFA